MEKISFEKMIVQFTEGIRRFPLSILFFFAFAMFAIAIDNGDFSSRQMFFLLAWTSSAAFLNMLVRICFEVSDRRSGENGAPFLDRRTSRAVIAFVVNVLWLGVCWLYRSKWPLDISWTVSGCVLAFSIIIAVFLVPFFGCRNIGKHCGDAEVIPGTGELGFWNYTIDTVFAAIVAGISGLILYGGIAVLLLVLDMLLGIKADNDVYFHIFLICATFIVPTIFLLLFPRDGKMYSDGADRPGKAGTGLLDYLFIPLLAAYIVTLYVYAARILVRFELPCGWVSVPLTVSFAGMLMIIFLLYPVQFRPANRFDKKVLRWLPTVFLPLLILMTAGIAKRISDYGMTIERLYLLVFNIWCYMICIGLIMCGSRKIWWIPASFVVILLLTSVGPLNISASVRRSLLRDVEKMIGSGGDVKFPLDPASYGAFLATADSVVALSVEDKLEYLDDVYPQEVVAKLVDPEVRIGEYAGCLRSVERSKESVCYLFETQGNNVVDIPSGFSSLREMTYFETDGIQVADTIRISSDKEQLHLSVPFSLVKQLDKESQATVPVWIECDEGLLYLRYLRVNVEGDIANLSLRGILFLK